MTQQKKPHVLFLAHAETGHLLKEIVTNRPFAKMIDVRTVFGTSGLLEGAPRGQIEKGIAGAEIVVLGPCRQSMHRQCDIFRAEAYAIECMRPGKQQIALFMIEPKCASPAYLAGMHHRVRMIFTIGDRLPRGIRRRFPTADFFDLLQLPDGETADQHGFFLRRREQECLPKNILELGRRLQKLVEFARTK